MDGPSIAASNAACKLASILGTSLEIVHFVPDLAVLSRWRAHLDTCDRVAAARQEIEVLVRGLECSVAVEMRVESNGGPNRLAEAAGHASDRAPIVVLGKKTPGPRPIAYRVLSVAAVPVLMHVDRN